VAGVPLLFMLNSIDSNPTPATTYGDIRSVQHPAFIAAMHSNTPGLDTASGGRLPKSLRSGTYRRISGLVHSMFWFPPNRQSRPVRTRAFDAFRVLGRGSWRFRLSISRRTCSYRRPYDGHDHLIASR